MFGASVVYFGCFLWGCLGGWTWFQRLLTCYVIVTLIGFGVDLFGRVSDPLPALPPIVTLGDIGFVALVAAAGFAVGAGFNLALQLLPVADRMDERI